MAGLSTAQRAGRENINLPKVATPADTTTAISAVLEAVDRGELAPGEGQAISVLIDSARKNFETLELEQRIRALDESRGMAPAPAETP